MKILPCLAVLALAAASSLSMASDRVLLAGTTITATFESKMAMKGYRVGGAELLQVNGDLKCQLIATTGLAEDGLADGQEHGMGPSKMIVGTVTPQVLVCDGKKKSIPVQGNILPARTAVEEQAPAQVDFIVAQPVTF